MTAIIDYRIIDTGYCLASESHVMRGGRPVTIHCHALVALLRHPARGWLLWDTGYAPRMLDATRTFPFSLYRRVTPLALRPELAAVEQLRARGIEASDIGQVIVSHFHADHVAGLLDFPQARLIATRAAHDDAYARRGIGALARGIIPALLPPDFAARATWLDAPDAPDLPHLGPTWDLFGDGALRAVAMPGHARGQIGLYFESPRGPVLLAADGCWLSRAYRERRPPPWIAGLIADDARAMARTVDALHAFATARPDVNIIPTHCPEAFERETGQPA